MSIISNEVVTLDFLDVDNERIFFISLTKIQFNNLIYTQEERKNVFQNLIECGYCRHLRNWKKIQQLIGRVDIKFQLNTDRDLLKNLSLYY